MLVSSSFQLHIRRYSKDTSTFFRSQQPDRDSLITSPCLAPAPIVQSIMARTGNWECKLLLRIDARLWNGEWICNSGCAVGGTDDCCWQIGRRLGCGASL